MGKNKYIETPDRMWELFQKYKEWCKSNPIKQHDFVGKDARSDYRKLPRCLTMEGFENYVADQNVCLSIDQYFSNKDDLYGDYVGICSRIRRVIRQDQIEGGMAGIYSTSITQRLNNLEEKTQTSNTIKITGISDDDLNEGLEE